MELAKITRSGLMAIAILVTALWGCLYAEQTTVRKAKVETYRALRLMYKQTPRLVYKQTPRLVEPASMPVRGVPAPRRPMIG